MNNWDVKNPFNPVTNIRFQIPKQEQVELKIFNSLGQEIRTLADKEYPAGRHTLVWNGKNNHGNSVASGVYIYKISTGSFVQTKKMSFLK